MSSEAITQNDLKNILNELGLGASSIPSAYNFALYDTGASTVTQTGTSPKTVTSITINSQTGLIFCMSRAFLQTSRYTSACQLRVDGNVVDRATTNATTDKEFTLFRVVPVSKGTHTVSLTITAQDSGTTATILGYRTCAVLAFDLQPQRVSAESLSIADYIVEQGTSGMWTYRKWNSGIAECWGYKSISTTFASWGSWYYVRAEADNYPTDLFTTVTNVQGQLTMASADTISSIVGGAPSISKPPNITGVRPTAAGSTYAGLAYWNVKGRWK